jgi:hypothetical protein
MITVQEAVKLKGCTRASIVNAIQAGKIDAERFGKMWAIIQNQKFDEWQPMKVRQESGRARWSTAKAKKPRKSA